MPSLVAECKTTFWKMEATLETIQNLSTYIGVFDKIYFEVCEIPKLNLLDDGIMIEATERQISSKNTNYFSGKARRT